MALFIASDPFRKSLSEALPWWRRPLMKRFILSLLLAGIAGAALAQNTPANVFVLGPHVLKQGVFTPVDLVLLNPTSVAGLQATLSYDPNVVEIPDPATEPALADF
jgi:hypothetical protein